MLTMVNLHKFLFKHILWLILLSFKHELVEKHKHSEQGVEENKGENVTIYISIIDALYLVPTYLMNLKNWTRSVLRKLLKNVFWLQAGIIDSIFGNVFYVYQWLMIFTVNLTRHVDVCKIIKINIHVETYFTSCIIYAQKKKLYPSSSRLYCTEWRQLQRIPYTNLIVLME